MANVAIPGRAVAQAGGGLRQGVRWVRQFPVIPLTVLLLVLVLPGIFAPYVAPHNPREGNVLDRLQPPVWVGDKVVNGVVVKKAGSWDHILGTDKIGRDMLSRIIYGARVSMIVALISIASCAVVGTTLGLIAGYFGGGWDNLIMRLVDIKLSLPSILLALVLVAIMGPSFATIIIVISLLLWTRYARLVRGEALRLKSQDFIARAKVAGASTPRILARHIFPNVVNTIIVLATLEIGQVILFEATLSFLGAGLPPDTSAWGLMIADGRALIINAWWVAFFPGLAIMLTVLSMNLLGDWMRDKLDPKLRNV